jgi:hypothetical protein
LTQTCGDVDNIFIISQIPTWPTIIAAKENDEISGGIAKVIVK